MNEDVIRKIRKLLALGESSNENEAAAAVSMAQRLMDRHAITEAMLGDASDPTEAEEIRAWEEPLGGPSKRTATWRGRLAIVLARANGCVVYTSGGLRIIGRSSDAEKVRYLFSFCDREIERLARARKGNGVTWLNSYRSGCVDAIDAAIKRERRALVEELRGEAVAAGRALVVVENAVAKLDARHAESWTWGKRKLRLRTVSRSVSNDPGARAIGRRDGASIYPSGGRGQIGGGQRRVGA